jgi:hypothetical protein
MSASGTVRVAGSRNLRRNYAPDFPVAAIEEAEPSRAGPGRIVTRAKLESLGLIPARSSPVAACHHTLDNRPAAKCLDAVPLNHARNDVDPSRAECLISPSRSCQRLGASPEQVAARLMDYSRKAQENAQCYADFTARRAAAIVATRRRKEPAR